MATITTINSGDGISPSRTVINTNFANLNSDKVETSAIDTDTTLAANSDSKIPSQKAVKAYVDAGGNVNASETAKGIVEEATDAEVLTGTATGATGAKLFVSPAKLAASPVSPIRSVLAGETINGATTPVPVYQNKSDNEFYACDANDTDKIKFLGFAVSNGTNGNSMNVQFSGVVSGFTGLAEGEKYYVQDTAGTIGTTAGTYAILVGVAISETSLVIQRGKHRRTGSGSVTDIGTTNDTQDISITLGFRPTCIRMRTFLSGSDSSLSVGVWENGNYQCVVVSTGATAITPAGNTVIIGDTYNGSTQHWTFTIHAVSDTGFTIRATQKVVTPTQGNYQWDAEGEL